MYEQQKRARNRNTSRNTKNLGRIERSKKGMNLGGVVVGRGGGGGEGENEAKQKHV